MLQLILCNIAKQHKATNAYHNDQQHLFSHFHASEMSNWINLWFGSLLLSKDQIFTYTQFSWPFDLCSLICILSICVNRVLKYEHFQGYFVVLWLIVPEIQWFLFPMPLNFGSKERRWAWLTTLFSELLPGYQKSTWNFWMCHIVYFNHMKRNLRHLSCTRSPP